MFSGWFIPPVEPITEVGMQLVGIFAGLVWLWTFNGMLWPSLLGIVAIMFSDYGNFITILAASFGNFSVWAAIFMMAVFGVIEQYEGECRFFNDAFLQTTYETKQKYEMAGKIVTPIYERHYWLNDMSELKTVKRDFDEHLKAFFDESFWQVYGEISALPGVLDTEIYEKEVAKVREQCSGSAYANFTRYGLRWINK